MSLKKRYKLSLVLCLCTCECAWPSGHMWKSEVDFEMSSPIASPSSWDMVSHLTQSLLLHVVCVASELCTTSLHGCRHALGCQVFTWLLEIWKVFMLVQAFTHWTKSLYTHILWVHHRGTRLGLCIAKGLDPFSQQWCSYKYFFFLVLSVTFSFSWNETHNLLEVLSGGCHRCTKKALGPVGFMGTIAGTFLFSLMGMGRLSQWRDNNNI